MVGFDILMFLHGCLNPLTTSLVTPEIFKYVLDQFSHVQSEDFIHICVEVLIKYFALYKKQSEFVAIILDNQKFLKEMRLFVETSSQLDNLKLCVSFMQMFIAAGTSLSSVNDIGAAEAKNEVANLKLDQKLKEF